MKTEETKRLESAIWNATSKKGVFGCFEVTIGFGGRERVDYMTYDTKGVFRCYEIKITKTDFRSPCHNSFLGNYNYYVMPQDLYEEIKAEIPDWVGVYTYHSGRSICNVKRATRRPVDNGDVLKDSLIRSLCREVTKQIQSGDDLYVNRLNQQISRLKSDYQNYYRKYWDLLKEIQLKYGSGWNKGDKSNEIN